jgi:hypothetical protein
MLHRLLPGQAVHRQVNGLTESEPMYQPPAVWLDTTGATQLPDACTPANADDARTRIIVGGAELNDVAAIGGPRFHGWSETQISNDFADPLSTSLDNNLQKPEDHFAAIAASREHFLMEQMQRDPVCRLSGRPVVRPSAIG